MGRSYQDGTETGLAGTPTGVISVQQLTHPDGTRAWVIEIPGTESWLPNDLTPMDADHRTAGCSPRCRTT